jgi:(+)-trans-carveol dehydrogenase
MGRLDKKVAFITGAARGQGRSHAVRLAQEGADIIAVDLCAQVESVPYPMATEADLAETVRLVEQEDRRIYAQTADVRDEDALQTAVDAGVSELGRLDIVVANAGIVSFAPADSMSSAMWQDVIDINQTGVWKACKVGIPHIRKHGDGGSLVLISSAAGLHAFEGVAHYVTAKTGLVGLTRAFALELGPSRIRVNCIHPTQVETPMIMNDAQMRTFLPDMEHPTREDFAPLSQAMHVLPEPWVQPVDISNAIVFLVSDEGRYITGATLPVDLGADLKA